MEPEMKLQIVKLEDHQLLWRYMDLPKFVSMLETKGIWLARADTVKDKHEGKMPDEMRANIENAYASGKLEDNQKTDIKNADDFQDYLVKNTFISCWHKNFDENMAMWEIYGKNSNAIAVQTTVKKVRDSVDPSGLQGFSLIMKDVQYKNADEVKGDINYEECFFRKRRPYEYEKEVRISLDTYDVRAPTKKNPDGFVLSCELNMFIEEIIVHPDSDDRFFNVVNSICSKYDIHASISRGKCSSK
ncbi:MAG: hypothetical protein EPN88_12705 [Bacteroidetes bacterium]|jgi:hypothetical protein|nr:MAG: hypothetical protein EPN88_12705 [Bacteroidota bacterium]